MKKAGMGHVEVVLAFFLFISSVLFIFYYFDVRNVTRSNDATLAFLESQIGKETGVALTTATFTVDPAIQSRVVKLKLPAALSEKQAVRAETYEKSHLVSSIGSDKQTLYVDRSINAQSPPASFIRVLASKDIQPENGVPQSSWPDASVPAIEASSTDTRSLLSERRLLNLNASYFSGYVSKKRELRLSERTDFAFRVFFSSEEGETLINAERAIPPGVSVSASTRRLEVLRKNDGRRAFADVTLRAW